MNKEIIKATVHCTCQTGKHQYHYCSKYFEYNRKDAESAHPRVLLFYTIKGIEVLHLHESSHFG